MAILSNNFTQLNKWKLMKSYKKSNFILSLELHFLVFTPRLTQKLQTCAYKLSRHAHIFFWHTVIWPATHTHPHENNDHENGNNNKTAVI